MTSRRRMRTVKGLNSRIRYFASFMSANMLPFKPPDVILRAGVRESIDRNTWWPS